MEDPSGNVPLAVRHDLLDDIEIDDNVAACELTTTCSYVSGAVYRNLLLNRLGKADSGQHETDFPPRSKFVSAIPHGTSFWTRTVRVNIELADGSTQANFLKIGNAEIRRNMVRSEFEGVNAIYAIVPDFVPRPIGWGTYKADQNKHFYMSEFIPMREELPDPQVFCAKLAQLHRDSISLSPNGKFGFHVATYAGNMPQDVTWCDTWEESFSRGLRGFAEQEKNACGPSEDLDRLLPQLFEKVIPRLLRPLQMGGRKLKPVLIHGDLWYGNIATNGNTGAPIAFDPAVLWAHNECRSLKVSLCND